jgi:hypothetical protein
VKSAQRAALKLLIRFTEPMTVRKQLNFERRAEEIVARHFQEDFDAALKRALATAK